MKRANDPLKEAREFSRVLWVFAVLVTAATRIRKRPPLPTRRASECMDGPPEFTRWRVGLVGDRRCRGHLTIFLVGVRVTTKSPGNDQAGNVAPLVIRDS